MEIEKFVQNVKSACEKRGLYVTNALSESGAGKGLMSELKKGQIPSVDRVLKLAQYFGCTVSDLLGDGEGQPRFHPQPVSLPAAHGGLLTEQDLELLLAFRSLNQEGQAAALSMIKGLTASAQYKKARVSGQVQEIG